LRCGGADRAIAQSLCQLDHEERGRQIEEGRGKFDGSQSDICEGQRLTLAFQQGEEENGDPHNGDALRERQDGGGGQGVRVFGCAGQKV
jgi:hypothetical protein